MTRGPSGCHCHPHWDRDPAAVRVDLHLRRRLPTPSLRQQGAIQTYGAISSPPLSRAPGRGARHVTGPLWPMIGNPRRQQSHRSGAIGRPASASTPSSHRWATILVPNCGSGVVGRGSSKPRAFSRCGGGHRHPRVSVEPGTAMSALAATRMPIENAASVASADSRMIQRRTCDRIMASLTR